MIHLARLPRRQRLMKIVNSKLGPLVDNDQDYVLRLFTANIVRTMCVITSELHEFWPRMPGGKKNKHEDFPLAHAPESAWVRAIADYMSCKDANRGFCGDS